MVIFYVSGESNSRKTTAMLWALCAFAKGKKDTIIDSEIYDTKPHYDKIATYDAGHLVSYL